jgi:threonine/homoserine/homoserine lactone efflux protein
LQPKIAVASGLALADDSSYKRRRHRSMLIALLLGFAFGFIGSMPVAGPVAILVFGRGLQNRARSGVYLAAGSAVAESVYAFLAFWGFSALLKQYPWIEPVSRALAAVILTALGLRFALARQQPEAAPDQQAQNGGGHKRSFLLGITITTLNPTLMVTWGMAVTALHSLDLVSFDAKRALPFSIGVWLGICGWFTVLLVLLARFKHRFKRSTLDAAVRVMGGLLTLLGLVFAVRFFMYLHAH